MNKKLFYKKDYFWDDDFITLNDESSYDIRGHTNKNSCGCNCVCGCGTVKGGEVVSTTLSIPVSVYSKKPSGSIQNASVSKLPKPKMSVYSKTGSVSQANQNIKFENEQNSNTFVKSQQLNFIELQNKIKLQLNTHKENESLDHGKRLIIPTKIIKKKKNFSF